MTPSATIVVNNYNYERFLADAIDSALAQTLPGVEVVVVDDGSTDGSRSLIAGYGDQIQAVLKDNGGQTSAFNAGFEAARSDLVCFLDADDSLDPGALAAAAPAIDAAWAVKCHWPLREVDGARRSTGRLLPSNELAEGDLTRTILHGGPECYPTPPTSGNLWSRTFLERVMPLPEIERSHAVGSASADAYLSDLAPLFGPVALVAEPLGEYRVHGSNDYSSLGFEEKLRRDMWCFDDRCDRLADWCRRLGFDVDPAAWRARSWLHRFGEAREELCSAVPVDASLVLVDGQAVGSELTAPRPTRPFLERDGEYWGAPENGAVAVQELERMRGEGADFIAFAWPAMWWLEQYPELRHHLSHRFPLVLDSDRVVAFDLR